MVQTSFQEGLPDTNASHEPVGDQSREATPPSNAKIFWAWSPVASMVQSSFPNLQAIDEPSGDIRASPQWFLSFCGAPPRMEYVHTAYPSSLSSECVVSRTFSPSGNQLICIRLSRKFCGRFSSCSSMESMLAIRTSLRVFL